ncbi:LOW QUALITY PROTEIN: beta-alanine-activating enzyme-like [Liolophura sinensis]|uniref:LOW QUALITY PROTEIN: beta-alanine-activating enzyme-like n=1 Tax=Liolophura sinensis TaxID=3198878 RepID=UPI00315962A2
MTQTLHSLFDAAAVKYAHHIAVLYDDGENIVRKTYRQVQKDAQQIKDALKELDACGRVIGLCCPPTDMLPSLLLGILSAGSSFHPVDLYGGRYSLQGLRLLEVDYLIIDVDSLQEVECFLRRADISVSLSPNTFLLDCGYLILRLTSGKCYTSSVRVRAGEITAYCITTSGTTGVPKVVRVPHRCIVPNIVHLSEIFELSEDDLLFLASPLTFDPSIVEIFLALTSGARILITLQLIRMVPRKFVNMVTDRHHVTVLQVTPTIVSNLGTELIRSCLLSETTKLRTLVFGGEKCPSYSMLGRWRSGGNQTKLFNVYGTTEVSCWATYYRIADIDVTSGVAEASVPLGEPLLDTAVEVRDEQGACVTEGEGELFIGSSSRVCIVGDGECLGQVWLPSGGQIWRPTGDRVRRTVNGKLLYLGRIDQQAKRHGMRLSLLVIEAVVSELEVVASCAASLDKGRLLLFVTCTRGGSSDKSPADLVSYIKKHVKASLPVQYHPDTVRLLTSLPLTKHGKVDKRALVRQTEYSPRECAENLSWAGVRNLLELHWKGHLGCEMSKMMDDSDKFIESGGNSFKAVNLASSVEDATGRVIPFSWTRYFETFKSVCDYVHNCLKMAQQSVCGKNSGSLSGDFVVKMDRNDSGAVTSVPMATTFKSEQLTNRKRRSPAGKGDRFTTKEKVFKHNVVPGIDGREVTMSVSRGSRIFYHMNKNSYDKCVKRGESARIPRKQGQASTLTNHPVSAVCAECKCRVGDREDTSSAFTVREVWRYNAGKCIDASPLVAVCSARAQDMVFIGSHSHLFSAVSMATGKAVWERKLGDRTESSACLTTCGKFVVVGCYDHCVYFLHIKDGDVHFKFKTGGEVKSSPVADVQSSLVFIGSHDQHLYALSPEQRQCVWKCPVGGGSVFSSPTLSSDPYQVIAASLAGTVLAAEPDTGVLLWQFQCTKPVFSSPITCPCGVCFGSVDGKVYFLSHQGELLWTFLTSAPIFSSPTLCQVNRGLHGTLMDVQTDVICSQDVQADVIGSQDVQIGVIGSQDELAEVIISQNALADVIGSQDVQTDVIGSQDVLAEVIVSQNAPADVIGSQDVQTDEIGSQDVQADVIGSRDVQADGIGFQDVQTDEIGSLNVKPDVIGSQDVQADVIGHQDVQADVIGSQDLGKDVIGSEDVWAVVIGSHDGHVYTLSCTGELLCQAYLGGAVYATPFVIQSDKPVTCGITAVAGYNGRVTGGKGKKCGTDGSMISFCDKENNTGVVEKIISASGKEYTVPALMVSASDTSPALRFAKHSNLFSICDSCMSGQSFIPPASGRCLSTDHIVEQIIVVPNTTGCLTMIGCQTGHVIACHQLNGQVFSSPVVLDDIIVIGCRDNHLYCLQIDG